MENKKATIPFGMWPSPITPAMLGQMVRLENPQFDASGTLVWLEGRSDRSVLVARPAGGARLDLNEELSVRGGVGYGGGEYHILNGLLVFAERGGRLYRRRLGYEQPRPITPPFGSAASPAISPDGRRVVYVFSDGKDDLLAVVDSEGRQWPAKLASGADFYMQPAWHPSGELLAWVEWDHPNMPWDGTRLMLGRLAGEAAHLAETVQIAGGADTPAAQPLFSPDGRRLSYIVAGGEFEDLVVLDLASRQGHTLVHGDGFHLSEPAWTQGCRWYGWSPDGQHIFYLRNFGGVSSLWWVDVDSGASAPVDAAPYTFLGGISVSPTSGQVACVASAPAVPDRIVRWDGSRLYVEAHSTGETLAPDYLPAPRQISWKAPDGMAVYGLYTAPANPLATAEGLPPAMLRIHGGPTSHVPVKFSAETAYFTSRGFGVLSVNYRGSTGYGRTYRQAQRLRWGEVDVEDAAGGAQALFCQRLADPKKLIIQGGSAGGYTVLNALERYPGLFKAGVCLFGVSNLFSLAMDTHKFEAHYTDSMVGPLPQAAERYHAWSPIFHAEAIRDPLAVFQGVDDKVVPQAQSDEIVAALRRQGVPHIYKLYAGEGHGFRKSETIIDYLQETERFLQIHVLFAA